MGLQISEHVEHHGIVAGRPVRTPQGKLSVLVEYPPDHLHPLSLLQYVSGKPLDWSEPPAPEMIGTLLAKLHALPLPQYFHLTREDTLLPYLREPTQHLSAFASLPKLIDQAVEAVSHFENTHEITYGLICGDEPELLYDQETQRLGLIDWGRLIGGVVSMMLLSPS